MLVFIYATIFFKTRQEEKTNEFNPDTPYLSHDTLMEMIRSEAKDFFSGSLTTLQAVSAVAARLELYVAE